MKQLKYKIIVIIIGLIIFESIFYLLAKLTPIDSFLLTSSIDNKIPLIEEFIYPYIGWYLMLFIVPYIIYCKNKEKFYEYVTIFMGCVIVSSIIFFLFPTTIVRGDILVNDVTTFILKFIYLTDTPALNCLPSMHCAICFVFIYSCLNLDLKWYYKLLIIILSLLVIVSTLFIKQHVIWDVLGAFILVIVVIVLIKIFKLDLYVKDIIKNKLKYQI